MADADDVRRLALALPHVVEIDSDGFDFRVADKGFVWSYPERRAGQAAADPHRHRGAVRRATRPRSRLSCSASPRSSSPRPATTAGRW